MPRSTPSKSKRNESRRSSILKPPKPRKPLQNVDFDSPHNETSSSPSKIKRRVSFADKKHVKEFCHTVEQGTVWDSTYEETDSAKGSFVGDLNAKTESKENKSVQLSQPSKDATLSIIACSNTNEKYVESSDEKSQLQQNMTNIKSYSCCNADFELNRTCIQDLSMEFTAPVPISLLAKKNINIEEDDFSLRLNLDTNYVSNNVPIQAVPVSAKTVDSDLGIFEQISKIQNREKANWDVQNNMHDKMIFSTNLQSNIASESIISKQTQDVTQNINESMMLTNVIQPQNINESMILTNVIQPQNINESMITNVIQPQNISESMMLTNVIQPQNINESMMLTNVIQPTATDMFCTNIPFNVSMEMTTVILPKIYDENISHPHSKNIIKENDLRENHTDKTEFFNDVMEITEPVNVPLITYDKENLRMDELISKGDRTIFFQNVSMEMNTVPLKSQEEITRSIIHKPISEENIRREKNMDNSIDFNEKTKLLCKSMEFTEAVPISLQEQTFNTIRTAEPTFFQTISKRSPENSTKSTLQVDTTPNKTIQHVSMEITAAVSSTLHLTQDARNEEERLDIFKNNDFQPLSVSTNNLTSLNKTCKSFIECHTTQENNVYLESPNDTYINNAGHSEHFVKDTMNYTTSFRSNFEDNLNEISNLSECSLLRKTLEYSIEELQTIEPPSFVSLDNDKEETFPNALCKDKLQISISNETINHNSSNQLVINNITQAISRKNVAKDNESSTILRENESINIENQMEDSCSENIVNKTQYNQEADCQALRRTIINDNLINESNHCVMNVENLAENTEDISSIQNNKHKGTEIDSCKSPMKESEIIAEEEHICERINDNVNLRNNVEEKQYSDVQESEIEQCTDPQRAEVIKDQLNSEKYCEENLINDEVRVTGQNEENREERFATEQCVTAIEESLVEQDPFSALLQELETHGERDDCIWNVYDKNINRKMIVFGFISNSLLITMFLSDDFNCSEEKLIKKIKIVSRMSNDSGVFAKIVHKLILEKLDAELLLDRYKICEDILPMLECVSQDVKLAMNFMFELKRLDYINFMEINCDEISFMSRSKKMDIIVKVTIKVKRFDELASNDVNVHCLQGTIKENDVKGLVKNIKKDHMFLRKYMNDVKDYVDIIEMTMPKKLNY